MRVTLHFAQSLDGRIAFAPPRERALLSSEEGIVHAHHTRAEHDAVLVGIRTIERDDPSLTVRACDGPQPTRVVLDSSLRISERAKVLARPGGGGPVIVCGAHGRADERARRSLDARGTDVCVLPASAEGRVALPAVLSMLAERGVRRLLVEGGAMVLTSFVRERLAERLSVEIALCLLGAPGVPAIHELWPVPIALRDVHVQRLGPNVLVQGEIVYGSADAPS